MVVQYISSMKYVCGQEINLLREASGMKRGYEIFEDEGIIKQFYSDNGQERNLNCWEVPDGARTMEFNKMGRESFFGPDDMDTIQMSGSGGVPVYRDEKGRIKKIGNH